MAQEFMLKLDSYISYHYGDTWKVCYFYQNE